MHKLLLQTIRNGYCENCFYGSLFLASKSEIIESIGESPENICFMRSLFKPIQSSILYDCNIIHDYKLTNRQIAIFSGSHAGSEVHILLLEKLMKKHKIMLKDLLLEPLAPLDTRKAVVRPSKLHNNCSGKHLMMLLMCKYMGFDYDYTNPNHPLQIIIKMQLEKLSGCKSDILSFDGCSTPLWGISYKNVIRAYFNLIEKYPELISVILNNPYTYGGYGRFDTEIIKRSKKNLFAKVGAGGLVLIYNFKHEKILLFKLSCDNNDIRRIIVIDYLNKLGWLNYKLDENIYNQKKQIVAKYKFAL